MGKYIKKARGTGAIMEMMRQGQLGVRTRARAQAMEKKELTRSWANPSEVSRGSFLPSQVSYLELRSRKLEKTVILNSNKPPSGRRTSSAECRRLSDLTNSGTLADDCSSRLALSAEEGQNTRGRTRHLAYDENGVYAYNHFHADNEVQEDDSLPLSIRRSLQQLRTGFHSIGRAPPGAAQSRSNSRSNSVSRELPPPPTLRSRGILTRNQRKMEQQVLDTIDFEPTCVASREVELDAFCGRHVLHTSGNTHSSIARNLDVEVSYGESPVGEAYCGRDRLVRERTPSTEAREVGAFISAVSSHQLEGATHGVPQACSFDAPTSLDMEIEDFFSQAEQQVRRQFVKQYNFDPVSDTPLAGRYDWVRL